MMKLINESQDSFEDYDICYECGGYGNDYYTDKDGELRCACDTCIKNPNNWKDGYWIGDDC